MFVLDAPVSLAHDLVTATADVLGFLGDGPSVAAAIVVVTVLVRGLLVPLAVAQARGERARVRLLPKIKALRDRHGKDPMRLRRELQALYAEEGASPFAGIGPALAQMPVLAVMYRLFVSATVNGHQNLLLAHTLLGTPLGQNWIGVAGGAGILAPPSLVFLGLFALLAAVAWWTSRHAEGPLRLLPFGTVVVAAFLPLAAGVYLLASTTWTAAERAVLRRRIVMA
ncbi:YidC/Oxa1 family membrane protein insertase [Actinomadura miaoliensis]|uniref:Membrane protein insertase YidC n=1 Tax=Actinomadura miaoliensis TaxID=430685 RepID=A0ABP7X425_9ACTN